MKSRLTSKCELLRDAFYGTPWPHSKEYFDDFVEKVYTEGWNDHKGERVLMDLAEEQDVLPPKHHKECECFSCAPPLEKGDET